MTEQTRIEGGLYKKNGGFWVWRCYSCERVYMADTKSENLFQAKVRWRNRQILVCPFCKPIGNHKGVADNEAGEIQVGNDKGGLE